MSENGEIAPEIFVHNQLHRFFIRHQQECELDHQIVHNVRISEWIEMVLFDMKCLAVLHSQFKDALCLLKIVIILYEHKCTWERSIQQITNVTQKIDQLIGWNFNQLINWTERQRRCLCRATSLTVNKRLKSVLAVFLSWDFT